MSSSGLIEIIFLQIANPDDHGVVCLARSNCLYPTLPTHPSRENYSGFPNYSGLCSGRLDTSYQ
ncbi:hypothetical protein HYPBUDRAFT_153337 [Hyphopichia burtonii NRRL Y-1933]|uniref:Uncharacterized protein n=1 Tax=Hyphopichia burtonii NRRL Y-1933 TaxID=984485 RepID=A0A1E4RH12_9ASCO|nr:hypothetical protein HYPBUDRAFT_153337 [Hyphopichia burtonii NRRL Y-1933]ODV66553.1 hypothetical protein HYPBUDRAFT_153337 [Hyphopichia burtonii NRRL Y-1933]